MDETTNFVASVCCKLKTNIWLTKTFWRYLISGEVVELSMQKVTFCRALYGVECKR